MGEGLIWPQDRLRHFAAFYLPTARDLHTLKACLIILLHYRMAASLRLLPLLALLQVASGGFFGPLEYSRDALQEYATERQQVHGRKLIGEGCTYPTSSAIVSA